MEVLMKYKNIIFEKEGELGVIRMNRPDALNALNSETFHELNAVFGGQVGDP